MTRPPERESRPGGHGTAISNALAGGVGVETDDTKFVVSRNPDQAAEQIATALGGHVIAARWLAAVNRVLGRRS